MLRRIQSRVLWGILLIGGGILILLQNVGVVPKGLELFWALVFAAAAVLFLIPFVAAAANWWAAIPGFALLGLAALLGYGSLVPAGRSDWSGSLFMGMLGLGFVAVYLRQAHHWWALIPGGVLVTLAAVAGLDNVGLAHLGGTVFFFGLGMTFALLAVVPGPAANRRWPLYPALALFLLALVTWVPGERFALIAGPVLLIGLGLYLLFRRPRHAPPVPAAPHEPESRPEEAPPAAETPPSVEDES